MLTRLRGDGEQQQKRALFWLQQGPVYTLPELPGSHAETQRNQRGSESSPGSPRLILIQLSAATGEEHGVLCYLRDAVSS